MSTSDKNSAPRRTGPKVFISYRRRSEQTLARLLSLELEKEFGADSVFVDVQDIAPSDLFPQRIEDAIKFSDVLVVLISRGWLEAAGSLRDPEDFVRREIAAALADERIRVLPVLVGGAQMPKKGDLPADIAGLTSRQAEELSEGRRWDDDVRRLVKAIRQSSGVPPRRPRPFADFFRTGPGKALLAALLVAAAGFAAWRVLPRGGTDGGANGNKTGNVNAVTPTPATTRTPTPTPSQDSAGAVPEACFEQFLPKGRWITIEYGDPLYHVIIRRDQPKEGTAGILFTEKARRVGAVRFQFIRSGADANGRDSGFFRVEGVIGPDCRPVEDYSNVSNEGERKGRLGNYDRLKMSLGGRHYFLRLGYWDDKQTISARFWERPD